MKQLLLLFSFSIFAWISNAQDYEQKEEDHTHNFALPESPVFNTQNWENKNLLTGKNIKLWNLLDSGYVIIHEYFMIDCRPCITAGKGLEKIVKSLKEKYPGRVYYFQTAYDDKTSAKQALKWVKENNFHPDAIFVKGAKEVEFYGGMGMPTIVVLGDGKRHKGFYKKQGYTPLENGKIISAVRWAVSVSKNKHEE